MRKIKVTASTRYVGSESIDYFEVEDNATEEEISEIATLVFNELVDFNWEEIKEEN